METKEVIEDLGINNYKIIQNKDYFRFGTDSVLLSRFAKSKSNDIVLDLCSGTGIIPIIFSCFNKYDKLLALEYQDEMYDLLERNISLNNINIISFKQDVKNIKKINKYLKDNNISKVNVITVNPPYKKVGTGIINDNIVTYNAKNESLCTLEDIFKTSSNLLENKGKLYLVHKPDRIVDLISIARKYKLEAKNIQYVYPNINSKPSIILIEYSKNGGNECVINKPLIQYKIDGNLTEEFKKYIII